MAGFASRDDIIQELTVNGKHDLWNFYKVSSAPEAAGVWHSLWTAVGNPGAGAAPGSATPGTAYNTDASTATAGAMWFPDRSTDQRHLLSFGAAANQNCTLMLYDLLVAVSGISTASTGNKTINSTAVPRYSGTAATLNEVWLEVTTATTTTAPIVSLNQYTTADGTTAQTGGTVTFPAVATNAQALVQVPLNASKQGVRSVEVGLNVATASAAGAVSVLIIRPLARIPLIANQWNEVSFLDDVMGLPQIFDNATLGLAILASGTTATTVWGTVNAAFG